MREDKEGEKEALKRGVGCSEKLYELVKCLQIKSLCSETLAHTTDLLPHVHYQSYSFFFLFSESLQYTL